MHFMRQVKIALCQLEVGTDKQANIQTATKAVKVRHSGEQAPVMPTDYPSLQGFQASLVALWQQYLCEHALPA